MSGSLSLIANSENCWVVFKKCTGISTLRNVLEFLMRIQVKFNFFAQKKRIIKKNLNFI